MDGRPGGPDPVRRLRQGPDLRQHSAQEAAGGWRTRGPLRIEPTPPTSDLRSPDHPTDAGEPGGGTPAGGGGAAEPGEDAGPGRVGRAQAGAGEQVPGAAGAAAAPQELPGGLARGPPVQPRHGGRDRTYWRALSGKTLPKADPVAGWERGRTGSGWMVIRK